MTNSPGLGMGSGCPAVWVSEAASYAQKLVALALVQLLGLEERVLLFADLVSFAFLGYSAPPLTTGRDSI